MKNFYLFILVVFMSCDKSSNTNNTQNTTPAIFEITSTAFANDSNIPNKYSCKATNQVFMPFSWKNAPKGTLSFVLLMEDSDAIAVAGYVWDHFLMYNISANETSIQEGTNQIAPLPAKALLGKNSFGQNNYGGPCPPSGQTHTYTFSLLALNVADLGLVSGLTKTEILNLANTHIIGTAKYKGKFTQ
jgi:Raf kinase inhibitor-like YbhB/YbcL family protein